MQKEIKYFTRFPNKYIQGDISTRFGISRKFYITYILIDRYRSLENFSWITIRKILNFYGYKTTKHKPKSVDEILDVLEYMMNSNMITILQDLDSLGYDTGIEIKIIPENFDHPDHFTKLTSHQLDTIMMADSSINKENLLMAFLYINSYIGCRSKNMDSDSENPEAFWRTIKSMSSDLCMSTKTISQCVEYLTTSTKERDALLIKEYVGYIPQDKSKPPVNAPNIYVLNKQGYQREIEWALQKMLEVFGVSKFIKSTAAKGE